MADQTAAELLAEIDRLTRLAQLVTDDRVRAEIRKMIEELERHLREIGGNSCGSVAVATPWTR